MGTRSVYEKHQREIADAVAAVRKEATYWQDRYNTALHTAEIREQNLMGVIEHRDVKIADLETEVSDLETIAEAVETHCRPRDGEEAYGWLMAQAVKALREERDRLLTMVVRTGVVERFAQCPCCFAERTNGEQHEEWCDVLAAIVGDPEDDHSDSRRD